MLKKYCSKVLGVKNFTSKYSEFARGNPVNASRAFTPLFTLPITTATAERSFRALRRLKTYLWSTMKEDRLSGLALMHIHKHDVSFSAKDIVDDFAASGNRRILAIRIVGERRFFIVVLGSIS